MQMSMSIFPPIRPFENIGQSRQTCLGKIHYQICYLPTTLGKLPHCFKLAFFHIKSSNLQNLAGNRFITEKEVIPMFYVN